MPEVVLSPLCSVEALGDGALTLCFGTRIDDQVNARVLALWRCLVAQRLPGVIDLVPAFTTLTVLYDPLRCEDDALRARLLDLAGTLADESKPARLVEIPVCYEDELAPDMAHVCEHTGLSASEVVRLHSEGAYRIHFLGFSPGFPYLGGLDPRLATPRRATPRTAVEPGSVGIGGSQTGVYPQRTPGGWQLIGRTPLVLFDPMRAPPALLQAGDRVQFVSIPAREYEALARRSTR